MMIRVEAIGSPAGACHASQVQRAVADHKRVRASQPIGAQTDRSARDAWSPVPVFMPHILGMRLTFWEYLALYRICYIVVAVVIDGHQRSLPLQPPSRSDS
jgi:hypothetical protein